MGIISNRQMSFGTASVPAIQYDNNPDIKGYASLIKVFSEAIHKKIGTPHPTSDDEKITTMYEELEEKEKERYTDYPRMSAEMKKGAIMSHQGLTNLKECVIYTMEYFQKERLFKDQEQVLKSKEVAQWIKTSQK